MHHFLIILQNLKIILPNILFESKSHFCCLQIVYRITTYPDPFQRKGDTEISIWNVNYKIYSCDKSLYHFPMLTYIYFDKLWQVDNIVLSVTILHWFSMLLMSCKYLEIAISSMLINYKRMLLLCKINNFCGL